MHACGCCYRLSSEVLSEMCQNPVRPSSIKFHPITLYMHAIIYTRSQVFCDLSNHLARWYTLDRSLSHHTAFTPTANFDSSIKLTCLLLDCGRKPRRPQTPHRNFNHPIQGSNPGPSYTSQLRYPLRYHALAFSLHKT